MKYPASPHIIAEEMADPGIPTEASGDAELVRRALIAENDAINLYQQTINITSDERVKAVLEHILHEEKEHIGELHELLRRLDPEYEETFDDAHTPEELAPEELAPEELAPEELTPEEPY